jgi:hypothetical protein
MTTASVLSFIHPREAPVRMEIGPLRQAEGDREVTRGTAHRLDDRDYVGGALDGRRAAETISATVRLCPEELVEEVTVAGVQLDAGRPRFARDHGTAHERGTDLVEFGQRRGAPVGAAPADQPGRTQ